jgi:S-adenosylmethionine-dependent methyltransferase
MTPGSDDPWTGLAAGFVRGYDSVWGQARTHVVHQHLRQHLPPPPAALVDVGGGAGNQSIPLAREGYQVTILDPSPGMLTQAAARLDHERSEVAERVRLVEGSGDAAPKLLGEARFAGVLCHGVFMYLEDPERMIVSLCGLAQPAGILSIVAKNAHALAMRPAYERDWPGVLSAFDAQHQRNGLGLSTRGDTVEGLTDLLRRHGAETRAWYGVRLFTEGWGRTEPPTSPQADVLAAELEASRRDPYRQLSRLFHLIAARRPDQ